jgi:hypothetical protein
MAAQLACIASPTHECHFRLYRSSGISATERVAEGGVFKFSFGSAGAGYCVAAESRQDAPCEQVFITAGFHFQE